MRVAVDLLCGSPHAFLAVVYPELFAHACAAAPAFCRGTLFFYFVGGTTYRTNDPYSVVLRRKKLPMGLLQEPEKV